MNYPMLSVVLAAVLALGACEKPAPVVVTVPVPVAVPGPAGPQGATGDQGNQGNQGNTGAAGATGKAGEGTTVIVMPPAASAPAS
jgi:hypothetical protein